MLTRTSLVLLHAISALIFTPKPSDTQDANLVQVTEEVRENSVHVISDSEVRNVRVSIYVLNELSTIFSIIHHLA